MKVRGSLSPPMKTEPGLTLSRDFTKLVPRKLPLPLRAYFSACPLPANGSFPLISSSA